MVWIKLTLRSVRQDLKNKNQMESQILEEIKDSWLIRSEQICKVSFGGFDVKASLYDILGPATRADEPPSLFDLDSGENDCYDGIEFDKEDIRKKSTLFLIRMI